MNRTGKARLLKLADFLETAELPGKFEMRTWSAHWEDRSCGTAACAFGWATTIPSFRKVGLRMGDEGWPTFLGKDSFNAAVLFFDIEFSEAGELFDPEDARELVGKRGRKIVAKRIRQFVDGASE